MKSNRADAIVQWQAKLLLNKTRIRPVPKDYPIPIIPIYTKEIYIYKARYFYKNETNLWDIYTMNWKTTLYFKELCSNE